MTHSRDFNERTVGKDARDEPSDFGEHVMWFIGCGAVFGWLALAWLIVREAVL